MCVFSAPKDNSAEIARQREEQRQRDIDAGTVQVNDIFSQFNDDYYSGIEKAHNDYYLPQVQDQYEDARRKMVLNLSKNGTLNGSVGARTLGDLDENYQTQKGYYANQGVDLAQQYRGDVERNRSDVLGQLNASANPSAAAATASARAKSLTAPPTFSPLAQLFNDVSQQAVLDIAARQRGYPGRGSGLFTNSSPSETRVG